MAEEKDSLPGGIKARPDALFTPPLTEKEKEQSKAAAERQKRRALTPQQNQKPLSSRQKKELEERRNQEEIWKKLVAVLHLNRRRLLRLPGVIAIDIGYKIKDGNFIDELALRLHVERKLHKKCFTGDRADQRLIADDESELMLQVPGNGTKLVTLKEASIVVDVIEADYRPSTIPLPRPTTVVETPLDGEAINRRRRIDPLVGGISIGGPLASVGTLGALVWDRTDGSVCILSNWHVLAGHPHSEPGDPCLQPGPFDRGREATDTVARLKRWSFDCQTDAAIAQLTGTRHYCAGEILGLPLPISGSINPYLGMKLLKSGRSTKNTGGFVDGLYFSTAIEYNTGAVQVFEDQIHIAPIKAEERISEPGDSGAVWVKEDTGEAVGLHFAGDLPRSAFGEYALANPMRLVEDRLSFSFRPVFLEIRDGDVVSLAPEPTSELENGEFLTDEVDESTGSTGPEAAGQQILVDPGGSGSGGRGGGRGGGRSVGNPGRGGGRR